MIGECLPGVPTVSAKRIYITAFDHERLTRLLDRPWPPGHEGYLGALRAEVARAEVVAPRAVPAEVVTMNSTVALVDVDTGEVDEYTLVYPQDADAEAGKVSVMAPLGTAMLGYRVGDTFAWDVPMGRRRWRVERVLYQPEAAGDYHL
jgi:regulator of nucleoside diphosphate kinase